MQTLDATATFKVNVVTRQIPKGNLPTHQRVYHQHQPTTEVNGTRKTDRFSPYELRKESRGRNREPSRDEDKDSGEH